MTEGSRITRRRQLFMAGIIFAVIVAALVVAYGLFLRDRYVVLLQGARPGEAFAIVTQLDKLGVAYELRDGGATIMVPESDADATRLKVAGSDAAAAGQIGFELFNKSDMGLTSFAQKINFQRALQGELTRTITMMDGVDAARVHLALPERALFRDDRTEPSAAVTLAMKPGQVADPARVSGIQRLVAAAVPDMPTGRVVVLDADGRIVSQMTSSETGISSGQRSAEVEERMAVEQYYHARARAAVEARLPGLHFFLRAMALPLQAGHADSDTSGPVRWTPAGDAAGRNFKLEVSMTTDAPLNAEDQTVAREAIGPAVGFDDSHGDILRFQTGPTAVLLAEATSQPSTASYAPPAPSVSRALPSVEPVSSTATGWGWILAGLLAAGLLGWSIVMRRRTTLSSAERAEFADALRRQLSLREEGRDAT